MAETAPATGTAPRRPEAFSAVDVIRTKRDGGTLTDAQIDWVVDAYTRGVVADEHEALAAMAQERRRGASKPQFLFRLE